VNVAPGERYSVIYQAADPGVWVWHCHILTHVERDTGMFGMVTALVVNEAEGTAEEESATEEPAEEPAEAESDTAEASEAQSSSDDASADG
jgi:hypothetical protein